MANIIYYLKLLKSFTFNLSIESDYFSSLDGTPHTNRGCQEFIEWAFYGKLHKNKQKIAKYLT